MSAAGSPMSMTQQVFGVIASREGATTMEVARILAQPPEVVRTALNHLRKRGLIRVRRFVATASGQGFPMAVWVATDRDARFSAAPLEREMRHIEDATAAARFAELMAGRRYEDTPRSPPIFAPRVYVPEPGTLTGCTAAMCVEG